MKTSKSLLDNSHYMTKKTEVTTNPESINKPRLLSGHIKCAHKKATLEERVVALEKKVRRLEKDFNDHGYPCIMRGPE